MLLLDLSWDDADLGDRLHNRDVEELRQALQWLSDNHDISDRRLAVESGVSPPDGSESFHVTNFLRGRTRRPRPDRLGKLIRFVLKKQDILGSEFEIFSRIGIEQSAMAGPSHIIKSSLGINDYDISRSLEWYAGCYVCFRHHYKQDLITASHLVLYTTDAVGANGGQTYSVPHFRMISSYPDKTAKHISQTYEIDGVYFCRNGNLYLEGKYDGEPKSFIMSEPLSKDFRYLSGVCLMKSIFDGEPFAAKVICERQDGDGADEVKEDKIGVFEFEEAQATFPEFNVIRDALGRREILKWAD